MLLDPPKREKLGQSWDNFQARGGGFPCPNLKTPQNGTFSWKIHEKLKCSKLSKMQLLPFFSLEGSPYVSKKNENKYWAVNAVKAPPVTNMRLASLLPSCWCSSSRLSGWAGNFCGRRNFSRNCKQSNIAGSTFWLQPKKLLRRSLFALGLRL